MFGFVKNVVSSGKARVAAATTTAIVAASSAAAEVTLNPTGVDVSALADALGAEVTGHISTAVTWGFSIMAVIMGIGFVYLFLRGRKA